MNFSYEQLLSIIDTKKQEDHSWFLDLLSDEKQKAYEDIHIEAVMQMLRIVRIRPHTKKIKDAKNQIALLEKSEENSAENYQKIKNLLAKIEEEQQALEQYRPFFEEPYFARMDLIDNIEGYNSYYIGKKGDVRLEIVDWRAPLARRYYQKSCSNFKINEYEYKTVLRRAIRTQSGKVINFKNEYLSLKEFLSTEELAGNIEENVLDPFLREIIQSRKEESSIKDIIQTIQEKQYEIITSPEKSNFVLQGCAGSGKTMVMLHRLSYLMYNNEEIKPRDVLMITPSNSFNAFIDELSQILELERVKTTTLNEYFLQVLKHLKIDIVSNIDFTQTENTDYLQYLYSSKFIEDIRKKTKKVYDDLYGLFTSKECKDFLAQIRLDCKEQISAYGSIKNASLRVRRCVLGEIKEKVTGGLYYTKPYRELMNCVLDVDDFLSGTLLSENAKQPDYFYRQLLSFYKSAKFIVKHIEKITQTALNDLQTLRIETEKEIVALKRFRQKIGEVEVYMYADRIQRYNEILVEIEQTSRRIESILEKSTAFCEFYTYLQGEKEFIQIGKSDAFIDIIRYFYRETIKKYKIRFGMTSSKLYPSDAYALCVVCAQIINRLAPVYKYIFVDEAQDISACEYDLLRQINPKAVFNVFGDTAQNVTPWRGVQRWGEVFPNFNLFELNQNYRNTNQIVDFVSRRLNINMQSIGLDGGKVNEMTLREISSFFKDKKGLKAIICTPEKKEEVIKKSYNNTFEKGKISKSKINIMTVYESKGLEFSSVVVVPEGMNASEEYIAYTRALKNLAVVKE